MRIRGFEKEHRQTAQQERFAKGEYHVCGLIVETNPKKTTLIKQQIATLAGCEIHAFPSDDAGKSDDSSKIAAVPVGRMLVTVEDTQESSSYDQMNVISSIDGVLAVNLMSHFFE
ncbi:hypothetical protein AwWohl_09830 [Gammaproteobacteria bacterium]|nr:hypothetical protein AwWohl_09830 [Gammaproteobacteria bacterium]